jgi:hypothetical protein
MRRPMRWYWAAGCSLLVFYVSGALLLFLTFGIPVYRDGGPLAGVVNAVAETLARVMGEGLAILCLVLLIGTAAAAPTLFVYGYLRKAADRGDGHLHCLKCGYILKGLSEPRCPECGERI